MKRTLLIILTIALLVAASPFGSIAMADEYIRKYTPYNSNLVYYYVTDKDSNCIITGFSGDPERLTIPSTFYSNKVVGIDERTFRSMKKLKSVTLPETMTFIGKNAFAECPNLSNVTLNNGLTHIGENAFGKCPKLTSITLPNSLSSMDGNPFYQSTGLTTFIVSPDHPTYAVIDDVLFRKADRTLVSYPNGKVGSTYTVPQGIASIGDYAFYRCQGLTSIILPDSVTSIGKYTFYECENLANISVPNSVNAIGSYAFYGCRRIQQINLPYGLTTIGRFTFQWCYNLQDVLIPASVTSIEDFAFHYCLALTDVFIPSSVTSIAGSSFAGCEKLKTIAVSADNPVYKAEEGVLFNTKTDTLVCYPAAKGGDYVIPQGTRYIGDYAFGQYCTIENVTIPDSVVSIGISAFENCDNLTAVIPPASVTQIGASAFRYCNLLSNVTLPNSLTSIGEYAFADCDMLKSVALPASLTHIDKSAFMSKTSLQVTEGSYAHQWCLEYHKTNYTHSGVYDWLLGDVMPTAKPTPTSTPAPVPEATASYKPLKQGNRGDEVLAMKKRLQELGYFTAGATFSNQYNGTTTERVKLFQKANGLRQTGVADEATLQLLFSDNAKKNPY